jgi:hypothetical protein
MTKRNPTQGVKFLVLWKKRLARRIPQRQPNGWEVYMNDSITNNKSTKYTIDDVAPTSEALSSRGGLSLFVRYLTGIALFPHLERLFGSLRKSSKGQSISEIFKQIFCFFVDGTSRHLVYFDQLSEDIGYAQTIETPTDAMLSSHAVKRFFGSFWWPRIYLFRRLLQKLFIWRLKLEKPEAVVLGIDVMVMDNDEAPKRHGVRPTYKKEKGFAPLQMTWGRFIIDAVFRSGDKHSNHSDTVQKMVEHVVRQIRKHYRADVPIVIRCDSGFFDQKVFDSFEALGIGYICAGRLVSDLKAFAEKAPRDGWTTYQQKRTVWEYVEFGDRRGKWKRFRRAIYCRKASENQQLLCDFARSHTVFYTNLGRGEQIDERLRACGLGHLMEAERIIRDYHSRGRDELVHRALKDFAAQELPFKRFAQNAAFYHAMLLAFFLYEAFKEDVCAPVLQPLAYPTTFRRKIIDIAAKIVRHSGRVIIKVPEAIWKQLRFDELWKRSAQPPTFVWV